MAIEFLFFPNALALHDVRREEFKYDRQPCLAPFNKDKAESKWNTLCHLNLQASMVKSILEESDASARQYVSLLILYTIFPCFF